MDQDFDGGVIADFGAYESRPARRPFSRGDTQADGRINIADAAFGLNYLYTNGPTPPCLDAADSNDDGRTDIADPIYVLNFLFANGPPPPSPGPFTCAVDRTIDNVPGDDLGCESYPPCD